MVAIATEMDLNLRKVLERWLEQQFGRAEDQVGVKALVVAVLTVEACSREKGKVSRPSKLEMILLGYYIEFGPRIPRVTCISQNKRLRYGEQVNRNFGIKSFLSQN